MNNIPGPWEENKAYEDHKDQGDSSDAGTQGEIPSGCGWKMALAVFFFMAAAKCKGG